MTKRSRAAVAVSSALGTIVRDMQRRAALARLGRHAALAAWATLFAPAARPQARIERLAPADDPFTLGVASGLPRPDGVTLWTRLAPRPREPLGGLPDAAIAVQWEVADDTSFARPVRRGEAWARPEHAHSVHVDVDGLQPDRRYCYRFRVGDAPSPTGRTRTAPAADADVRRLRLALASCQNYEHGEFTLHRALADADLDLVLFVGDYIYESGGTRGGRRVHEGPQPTTLAGFRQRHATYKLDPALQASHAAHPWLLAWDDHEVENDYAGTASRDPARSAEAFLRLRTAAYQAYFEHMPISPRQAPVDGAMTLHGHTPWGRLADLWTLDNRQYRSLQPCNPPGVAGGRVLTHCDALDDPAGTMFGAAQERWIGGQLAASTRGWRLLAQGTQIAPAGVDGPQGRSLFSDGWDGYPRARERLLRAIADQPLGNVVCLGGDVHRHAVARLRADPRDPAAPVVAAEFATSSLSSRGLSDELTARMLASNPDLLHARSDERGYVLLDVTSARVTADLQATAHPVTAASRVHTQARYVVEAGRPEPQRDA